MGRATQARSPEEGVAAGQDLMRLGRERVPGSGFRVCREISMFVFMTLEFACNIVFLFEREHDQLRFLKPFFFFKQKRKEIQLLLFLHRNGRPD